MWTQPQSHTSSWPFKVIISPAAYQSSPPAAVRARSEDFFSFPLWCPSQPSFLLKGDLTTCWKICWLGLWSMCAPAQLFVDDPSAITGTFLGCDLGLPDPCLGLDSRFPRLDLPAQLPPSIPRQPHLDMVPCTCGCPAGTGTVFPTCPRLPSPSSQLCWNRSVMDHSGASALILPSSNASPPLTVLSLHRWFWMEFKIKKID